MDVKALKELAEAATPGPWDYDVEKNEGDYGAGEDCSSGFDSYAICDEKGQTLFDSLNSDAACVQDGYDGDYFRAWDEVAERNAKFIAAANPAAVLELIGNIEALEARIRELEQQPTEAWLIEWTYANGKRQAVCVNNCIADYRAMFEDATVTELVRRAAIAKEQQK